MKLGFAKAVREAGDHWILALPAQVNDPMYFALLDATPDVLDYWRMYAGVMYGPIAKDDPSRNAPPI